MKIYLIQWTAQHGCNPWVIAGKDERFIHLENPDPCVLDELEVYLSPEDAEKDFKDPEDGEYSVLELEI